MPDAAAVQKFDVIVAQPLTESCRTWLIGLQWRGSAGHLPVPAFSLYSLRRELSRIMSTVISRAPKAIVPAGFARVATLATLALLAMCAAVKAESPAGYMKRVGNELLAASRSGSATQFAMVLNSNADIPSIGLSALGDYARVLPKPDRQIYYNGMINFIARYASKEAPKYPIARFIVTAQSKDDPRGTYVDSRITLASGDGYDVRWLVVRRGSTYKVRDAQVIGFWMTSFLDTLFQNYISENGGNPKSLVVALNR